MKNNFLKSTVAGLAITAAFAGQQLMAAFVPSPIPIALNLTATVTYNTNEVSQTPGLNGGGTNYTTSFTFNSANLLQWLQNSSDFTNALFKYTLAQSTAKNFNASLGRNPAAASGIMALPAGCYIVIAPTSTISDHNWPYGDSFGGVGITNASGFWFPLSQGYQYLNVPQKTFFSHGYTTTEYYVNHTYLSVSFAGDVGQGNVSNTGGAEADKGTWALTFDNFDDYNIADTAPNFVGFSLQGILSLTWTAAAPSNSKNTQAYTLVASGKGLNTGGGFALPGAHAKPNIAFGNGGEFAFLAPAQQFYDGSILIQANFSLNGNGVGPAHYLDGKGNGAFWKF
jgi:hypothetical protein